MFGKDPRAYGLSVTEFRGAEGEDKVKSVVTRQVQVGGTSAACEEEKVWQADLVILAMGFVSPESAQLCSQLSLQLDQRNNIHALHGDFRTTTQGVFAAGDCRRGQSLVVWAINEGRGVAQKCHEFLCAL